MFERLFAAFEQRVRLPGAADYLRHLARHDRGALAKLLLAMPFVVHRRGAPVEVVQAARLAATRALDCGTCLQIVVNEALAAGVGADLVRAILDAPDGGGVGLPAPVAEAVRFGAAVATGADPAEERAALRARYGETGLVSIATGATGAALFPILKRGLGFATSCALVEVTVAG